MPQLIRTIGAIMRAAERDMLFVRFGTATFHLRFGPDPRWSEAVRRRHLRWFEKNGLKTELAAPDGWMEGDPGVVAVHFDGPDDPRIAEYSAVFEDADGASLAPRDYQMGVMSFAAWSQRNQGRAAPDNDAKP